MITISVRGTKEVMDRLEREKDDFMTRVAQDTLSVAVQKTPIDEGQARRGWRLEDVGVDHFRIVNRVPYINRLENGYSKQAPRGILGPTLREISKRRYR